MKDFDQEMIKLKTKSKFERYTYIEQLNIRRVI